MNRDLGDRLDDVIRACGVIARYVEDDSLPEDLVYDAVRMRLVEIGEAVRMLPSAVTSSEPGIPWSRVSLLGERLTRRYFDTTPAVVFGTARVDVPALREAVRRLRAQVR
ncbi:HepT-like ribonuclease domain-containing protein [Curtobacterium sp. SP.BCo]|uniref:HepT-like ribonuclease domain-containing protein n=1 Tax=Curtobacterium sp. SP.BCo TaxID=3435229 RepID=UPI003F73DAEA